MSATFYGFVDESGKFKLDFPAAFKTYVANRLTACEVEIEIREKHKRRSQRQNDALHAMITPWAKEVGIDPDVLKVQLLIQVFGTKEVPNVLTGEVTFYPREPHTSKLTVAQFSELIERTMELAAGQGHILVAPDEYRAAHPEKYPVARKRSAA